MGLRSSDAISLVLDGAFVAEENRIGDEGVGFKVAMSALDGGRIGVAYQALGIADACLDAAARVREQAAARSVELVLPVDLVVEVIGGDDGPAVSSSSSVTPSATSGAERIPRDFGPVGKADINLADPGSGYFIDNDLDELDAPGEWFLDRECGVLYFWPPTPLEDARVEVSVADGLFRMTNTGNDPSALMDQRQRAIDTIRLLGLLVLIVACVNYTNLATAQSIGRAREVGLRKTFGAADVDAAIGALGVIRSLRLRP